MLFHLLFGALGDRIGWLRVFRYPSTRILAAAISLALILISFGDRSVVHRAAQGTADRRDHPHGRPADPQEEGRHADDGRLAHPVLPRGLDAAVVRSAQPVRVAGAHGHGRVRCDRLRRRLHQAGEAQQARHQRQAPARARVRDRGRRDGLPDVRQHHAGGAGDAAAAAVHRLLHLRRGAAAVAVLHLRRVRHRRLRQCRQPDRRPRRPRDRSVDHERRDVPDLRVHRRCRDHDRRAQPRRRHARALPPRRAHRRRRGARRVRRRAVRRRRRLPLVQRLPGPGVHGRRRLAVARRLDRHARRADQERADPAAGRRAVRDRGAQRDHPGRLVQDPRQARVQDGADPPPLRARWDEPKIIVRFWLVSLLFALLALGTLKIR